MRTGCSAAAGARRTKWAAMAAGALIQCFSGASYAFGVYSPLLKSSQGYDQSTLDSVAFFKDIGANVGVLSGLLISSSSSFGRPWFVLAVGATQCLAGYLPMWLSVSGAVPRPPPAAMCAYMLVAAHAQTFLNTADVVVAVQNFPEMRGTVIGIMKGFLGLSGAILVQIYRTILDGDPSSFLLMLALLPSTLTFLLMSFVEVHHNSSTSEKKFLDAFSLISLVIAGYLMIVIIGQPVITKSSAVHILSFLVLILLLLSPVIIAVKAHMGDSELLAEGSCHERIRLIDDDQIRPGVHEQRICDPRMAVNTCFKRDHMETDKSTAVAKQTPSSQELLLVPREESISTSQAMMTLNFWLLFIAMACGMGSGLATVNNVSQIGGSLGYTSLETSTLVSLWSIWNFLGRFGIGYVSDHFLRVRGWPRPLFIVLTLAGMSVGHAVISSGLPGSLYAGSVIVGVCYGSQWALMPSITSEIFGLRHFGTIFNTIAIASPCGSYILSVRVVGYIYDRESSFSPSGLRSCTGRHCFMLSFLIMASGTLLGSAVALVLFYRTRKFYKRIISRAQNL